MAALLVEVAVAGVVLTLVGHLTRDPEGEFPSAFAVILLPVFAVLGSVPGFFATVSLVLPSVSLARWAEERWGRAGARSWWWVPAVAPVVSAALLPVTGVLFAAVFGAVGSPMVYVWWWLALTVTAVPAALLARLAAFRTGPWSGLKLAVRVVATGAAVAVGLGLLGGLAYGTGLSKVHESPRPNPATSPSITAN
jgi:hypothetical protein